MTFGLMVEKNPKENIGCIRDPFPDVIMGLVVIHLFNDTNDQQGTWVIKDHINLEHLLETEKLLLPQNCGRNADKCECWFSFFSRY